jgi:hypothetical protein
MKEVYHVPATSSRHRRSRGAFWPLILYQGPIVSSDTAAYLSGAATGAKVALGFDTELVDKEKLPPKWGDVESGSATAAREASDRYVVSSGRSPWYGMFLLAGVVLGDGVGVAVLQGLCIALAIALTTHALLGHARQAPVIVLLLGC